MGKRSLLLLPKAVNDTDVARYVMVIWEYVIYPMSKL